MAQVKEGLATRQVGPFAAAAWIVFYFVAAAAVAVADVAVVAAAAARVHHPESDFWQTATKKMQAALQNT